MSDSNPGGNTRADHEGKAISGRDTRYQVFLLPNNNVYPDERGRDITGFVSNITIEEGLTKSSLLTTLTIRDGVNMLDDMRISGNERITIDIRQLSNEELKVNYECYISDVVNFSRKLHVQTYQYLCVSEAAYLNNLGIKRSWFEGGIGTVIGLILDELNIKKEKRFIFDGGGVMKGIFPNLRPLDAINWLKRNTFDGRYPLYFFESLHYEDPNHKDNKTGKGGLVFASYKEFIKPWTTSLLPFFQFRPYGRKEDTDGAAFDDSQTRILKISTNLGMSKFNQIPKGAYGSRFLGVDLAKKELIPNNKGSFYGHTQGESYPRLDEFKSFATTKNGMFGTKYLNEYEGKRFFSSLNSLAFDGDLGNYNSTLEKSYKSLQHATSIKENLNYLNHTIDIEGNFNIWAGKVIEIEMPKAADLEHIQGADELKDEILSGKYLITNLVHTFKDSQYIISATCAKDSSMIDLDSEGPKPPEQK